MSYIIASYVVGDATLTVEQAKAAALNRFKTSSIILSQMVSTAYANLLASGKADPSELSTLMNNIGRLNNIGAQVNAGDTNKIEAYGKVAKGLIDAMNDTTAGQSIWANFPSVEQEIQIIMNLPKVIADAVVAVAEATGKTIKAVADGAGIDPRQVSGTLDKLLLVGGLAAGAVILTQLGPIIRLLVPKRKKG